MGGEKRLTRLCGAVAWKRPDRGMEVCPATVVEAVLRRPDETAFLQRRSGVQSGMIQPPPAVPAPIPAPATPSTAATPQLTENQAFTRAWVLFFVLFVVVIGVLWALKAHYG
ncbi:hypothetical protein VLK31_19060 [Variovorax sp. H27-G14]|uniref:hypothetical protein n=1 Tax=Variovorax sp. H27-G14 TaxID=3111914 RepID=UPI0038FC7515